MSDKKIKKGEKQSSANQVENESIEARRKRLKQILASGGMFVGAATMQKEWTRPVIDSVILPVHALTSALNGSFTGAAEVSTDTDLLDYLVPQAHAVVGYHVELCINVVNGVANVEVTVEYDWWLYTGSQALNFDINLLPNQASGGNHDINVTGTYDEKTDQITGKVKVDGLTAKVYTADRSTATCALKPQETPPATTTP